MSVPIAGLAVGLGVRVGVAVAGGRVAAVAIAERNEERSDPAYHAVEITHGNNVDMLSEDCSP